MRRIIFILMTILMIMPSAAIAESYDKMWAKVSKAEQADLPRTQMEELDRIILKAEREREYGHLLKAGMMHCHLQVGLTPDSIYAVVADISRQAEVAEGKDKALAAVYNTILSLVYKNNRALDENGEKARAHADKAMADIEMLAKCSVDSYEPFVEKGIEGYIFEHSLLGVVGYWLERYADMHQWYKSAGNRKAAMLTALYMNDRYHRYPDDVEKRNIYAPGKFKDSPYRTVLDSLMAEYSDLEEAGEIAISMYRYMSTCSDVSVKDRVSYIDESLLKWRKWERMSVLRTAREMLTQPQVNIYIPQRIIAPQRQSVIRLMSLRNVGALNVKVTPLDADGTIEIDNWSKENISKVEQLKKSKAVYEETKRYDSLTDYEIIDDSLMLPCLQPGVYLVEVNTGMKGIGVKRELLYVTGLYVLNIEQPGKTVRYAVVDVISGQPVSGAQLSVMLSSGEEKVLTCDEKGEALLTYRSNPNDARAFTADDKACPRTSVWNSYTNYAQRFTRNMVRIYTDRAIYRPGQTVNVAVLAYKNVSGKQVSVLAGEQIMLQLRDANYRTVSEMRVVTDEYGKASALFSLPGSGLTGHYTLRTDYGTGAVTSVRVEEYKRPTFTVEFEDINERYADGDTLLVKGYAKTYSGVPVQGARVSYVARREHSAWWWKYVDEERKDIVLERGTAVTAADGSFAVSLPIVLPSSDLTEDNNGNRVYGRAARFYNFVVEADVTDLGGETRHGEILLPLGSKPTAFTCDMPKQVLADSLKHITFSLYNAAGKPVDGDVEYYLDSKLDRYHAKANKASKAGWMTNGVLQSGSHTLTAVCGEDTLKHEFVVFSMKDTVPCIKTSDWFYSSGNFFTEDGTPVYIQLGSSDNDVHVLYSINAGDKVIESGTLDISNALVTREFTYKEEYGTGVVVNYAWVKDGRLYTHKSSIEKPLPDKRLIMKWQTFRDRLTPGQKEEWILNVTRPDGKPAEAQVMATMYDKSLDVMAPLSWDLYLGIYQNLPQLRWRGMSLLPNSMMIQKQVTVGKDVRDISLDRISVPMFFRQGLSVKVRGSKGVNGNMTYSSVAAPLGRMESEQVYSSSLKRVEKTGSVVNAYDVKGNGDEAVVTEETERDAAADQLLTTISPRENLNETAFFFPTLVAGDNGRVSIKFVLPESVTTWKFMAMAHDKDMNNGFVSAEAVASKPLMIVPNVPRFVRVGDNVNISARIFNTTSEVVNADVVMQLTDASTGKEVKVIKRRVAVSAEETSNVTFEYIPDNTTELLICKVIVNGRDFSDGEQHYLPVLPEYEMLTDSRAFIINETGRTSIDISDMMPETGGSDAPSDVTLTVEYTDNPMWLMLQALPFVADMTDKNAVNVAGAYYTNRLGKYIVDNNKSLKTVFEQWKREADDENSSLSSNLNKNQDLKTVVLNETPWVCDAMSESDRKAMIGAFFDDNLLDQRLSDALDELAKSQNDDGSWSWWKGMKGSRTITLQVAEYLARVNAITGDSNPRIASLIEKAMAFVGAGIIDEVKMLKGKGHDNAAKLSNSAYVADYLYVNAMSKRVLSSEETEAAAYLKDMILQEKNALSLYNKARMAVVLARSGDKEQADEFVESLVQYSVKPSSVSGRYFETPRAEITWCDYRIPTQVAAIEAIESVRPDNKSLADEMRMWLLLQKRSQMWSTPINSVNAIYAFFLNAPQPSANVSPAVISVDGSRVADSDRKVATGYVRVKEQVSSANTLTVDKRSDSVSWGAAYVQYKAKVKDIESYSEGFDIRRQIFVADEEGRYHSVDSQKLSVGDKVKVRILVTADRDYDFVQISDKRAACLEPVEQQSGYRFGYYIAVKDNVTNFFFDRMPKGSYVIENEYYVNRRGLYTTGISTVQCAYSPEFMARQSSSVLVVE